MERKKKFVLFSKYRNRYSNLHFCIHEVRILIALIKIFIKNFLFFGVEF